VRRYGGQPFVLGQQSGSVPRLTTDPLPTIATKGAISLVQPFLIAYYGSGANVSSVEAPLRTVTTRDRFGLVRAEGGDLTLRMLRLHELSAAMGFPADYRFTGSDTDAKAMVGNAVEVNQAAALWQAPVEQVLGVSRRAA
jgi:DNA (cytosine-5)-methyltransferase 1